MHYARDMGSDVIGITDTPASPIAKLADIALFARSDMVSFLVRGRAAELSQALIVATSAKARGEPVSNLKSLSAYG